MVQRSNKGFIIALSADGIERWTAEVDTGKIFNPLLLPPNDQYLFFLNEVYETSTGTRIPVEFDDQVRHFFVGADNLTYYLSENSIFEVIVTPEEVIVTENGATTEASDSGFTAGVRQGGVLPDGTIWFDYWNSTPTRFYAPDGSIVNEYQPMIPPYYTTYNAHDYNRILSDGTHLEINTDSGILMISGPSAKGPATLVE